MQAEKRLADVSATEAVLTLAATAAAGGAAAEHAAELGPAGPLDRSAGALERRFTRAGPVVALAAIAGCTFVGFWLWLAPFRLRAKAAGTLLLVVIAATAGRAVRNQQQATGAD